MNSINPRDVKLDAWILKPTADFLTAFGHEIGADMDVLNKQVSTMQSLDDMLAIVAALACVGPFTLIFGPEGYETPYFVFGLMPFYNPEDPSTIQDVSLGIYLLHPRFNNVPPKLICRFTVDQSGAYLAPPGYVFKHDMSESTPGFLPQFLNAMALMNNKPFLEGLVALLRAAVTAFDVSNSGPVAEMKQKCLDELENQVVDLAGFALSEKLLARTPDLLSMLEKTLNLPEAHLVDPWGEFVKQNKPQKPITLQDMQDMVNGVTGDGITVSLKGLVELDKRQHIVLAYEIELTDNNGEVIDTFGVAVGEEEQTSVRLKECEFMLSVGFPGFEEHIANGENGNTNLFDVDGLAAFAVPSDALSADQAALNRGLVLRTLKAFEPLSVALGDGLCEQIRKRAVRYLVTI